MKRVVVIVDRTASMNSADVKPSRFSRAKRDAIEYVSSLPLNCEVVLLSFASTIDVNCRLTKDHEWVIKQLEELQATEAPGDSQDAMKIAQVIVSDIDPSEIRLFSDESNSQKQNPKQFNLGVTQFHASRNRNNQRQCSVFLEVCSTSSEPTRAEVELSLDSKVIDIIPVYLENDKAYRKTFTYDLDSGGTLKAKIIKSDFLSVDNSAWHLIDAPKSTRVLLISDGNQYLESVLKSIPNVTFEIQDDINRAKNEFDIVIFDNITPDNIEDISAKKLFFINPQKSNSFFTIRPLDSPERWSSNSKSILAESVEWESIDRATSSFNPTASFEVLAQTSSGNPTFFSSTVNGKKVLSIAADLENSNLALKTGFPILMSNAIHWFMGRSEEETVNYTTGTPIQKVFGNFEGLNFTHLVSPSGKKIGMKEMGVLEETGEWKVFNGESETSKLTVSLTSKKETRNEFNKPAEDQSLNSRRFRTRSTLILLSAIALIFEGVTTFRLQLFSLISLLGKIVFGLRVFIFICLIVSLFGFRFESNLTSFKKTHLVEEGLTPSVDSREIESQINTDKSDIDLNLLAAFAMTPNEMIPEVEFWSNGKFDAKRLKTFIRKSSVPIAAHHQRDVDFQQVKIEKILIPKSSSVGEFFELKAVVWSDKELQSWADLFVNGLKSKRKLVSLKLGRNEVDFQIQIDESPRYEIKLNLLRKTSTSEIQDSAKISGTLESPEQILLVGKLPESLGSIANALIAQGVRNRIMSAVEFENTSFDLNPYSSVLLSNLQLTELPTVTQNKLEKFVAEEGGGLIVLGGKNFIPPNFDDKNKISKLLPIIKAEKDNRQKQTMIFAIDHSGSMRGNKLLQAKSAIAGSVQELDGETSVGIISFNERAKWNRQPSALKSVPFDQSKLSNIQASGGTEILSVLNLLRDYSRTNRKAHLVLLSDGQTAKAEFSDTIRELNIKGVKISVIAIGEDVDESILKAVAVSGQGSYYHSKSSESIPKILLRETQRIQNQSLIEESFFVTRSKLDAALLNIDFDISPLISKANKVKAKKNSEVLLHSEQHDPVLVVMQSGLGRSLFFASNFNDQWANEWLEWEQFSVFLAQLVRKVSMESSSDIFCEGQFLNDFKNYELEVQNKYGEPINDLQLSGSIRKPDDVKIPLVFQQNRIGTYQSNSIIEKLKPGNYEIEIFNENLKRLHPQTIQIPVPTLELPGFESAENLNSVESFSQANKKAAWKISKPLWPYLITVSLLLLFACIFLERSKGLIS